MLPPEALSTVSTVANGDAESPTPTLRFGYGSAYAARIAPRKSLEKLKRSEANQSRQPSPGGEFPQQATGVVTVGDSTSGSRSLPEAQKKKQIFAKSAELR